MNQPRQRLGEILLESGAVSKEQLDAALKLQKHTQLRLGTILLQEGFISENNLIQALSRNLSIPWVSIWRIEVSEEIVSMVPLNITEDYFLFPIYVRLEKSSQKALYVAMNDPSDTDALELVSKHVQMDTKPMLAAPSDIAAAIRYYHYGEKYIPEENEKNKTQPSGKSMPPNPLAKTSKPPAKPVKVEEPLEDLSDEIEILPSSEDSNTPNHPTNDNETKTKNPNSLVQQKPQNKEKTIFEDIKSAQREAERRIYGVGHKKQASGFALTLLDGTTISFARPQENQTNEQLSKEDFLAALKAVAAGAPVEDILPATKWQSYIAAMLTLLFQKGLFLYDEFISVVESIEKK